MLIQYVRLFPLARMRVSDLKLADRMEQTLRVLQSKYQKKPKSENLLKAISEVTLQIKSQGFAEALIKFFEEEEQAIIDKEIEISNAEVEEARQPAIVIPTKKQATKGRNFAPTASAAPQSKNMLGLAQKPKDKKRGGSRQSEASPAGVKDKKGDMISSISSKSKAPSTAGASQRVKPLEETKDDKTTQSFTKQKKIMK